MSNHELLERIRLNKESRDKVINEIYYNKKLKGHFTKMIGSIRPDSEIFDNIFNQALIQFISTIVKRPDFEFSSDWVSYITTIGKNIYLKHLKDHKTESYPDQVENQWSDGSQPENLFLKIEKKEMIFEILGKLGKNCREVLLLWANGYTMQEIAHKMEYQSEGMARKKKYQCFKEFSQMIADNPHYKNILIG